MGNIVKVCENCQEDFEKATDIIEQLQAVVEKHGEEKVRLAEELEQMSKLVVHHARVENECIQLRGEVGALKREIAELKE